MRIRRSVVGITSIGVRPSRAKSHDTLLDPVGRCHRLAAHPAADPEHLGRIGVPLAHELRGVGENMQDHYVARVSYPIVGAQTANKRSRDLPLAGEVMR